ncbi:MULTISPECIES: CHASE2 domain-containing protein [Lysobacter]|uniref:CHASE2 domain-containing protein n=1 Tax=Lysobacter TaxID=68 RepID=UPI001F44E2A2|nr:MULTISPECIES: CHASE2 domain-containing protein [Lysobacter]UJB20733.1 CHASE2 domain-containing protein [Lysobacter capsici]UJQ30153.1 CHASE2 domain-containing protein [Lysobacter gummosus]
MSPTALSRLLRGGAALCAAGLAALLTVSGATWRLDDFFYDQHLSNWGYAPDDDVVIVAIDDRSLNELGQWPWPRDIHAQVLDRLGYAGVRGVALDLVLAEADRSGDDHDLALAASMRRLGRVALPVTTAPLRQNGPPVEVLPTPVIATAANTLGHTDIELDAEGTTRGMYLKAGLGDSRWPALGLALIGLEPGAAPNPLPGLRRPALVQGSPYQWTRDNYVRIRFAGPPGTFGQVSYSDVLSGQVPAELLRGRWVVIGVTATGLVPRYLTPMSDDVRMHGAEYQANVIEMLLHSRAIVPLSSFWQALLAAAMLLAVVSLMLLSRFQRPLLITGAAALLTAAGSVTVLRLGNLWFPPAATIVMIALAYLAWMVGHLRHWRREANLDTLTRLGNRRRFDHVLQRELASARRTRAPMSLALIDVDYFKAYNDSVGHRAGDKLLQKIAEIIASHARRPRDLAARFGGDEFAVILPDTHVEGAARVADMILADMRKLDARYGQGEDQRVSLSIGLYTCVPGVHTHVRTLFDGADAALYRAKENGRDRREAARLGEL